MAVEDRVVIRIDIDSRNTDELAKIIAQMKALEAMEKRLNKQGRDTNDGLKKIGNEAKKLEKTLASVGKAFFSVFKFFSKLNFIGMAADIGLVSLALGGVKLALMSGRFAVKAWQTAMQGLGAAAAAAALAIGTVAAALNEFHQVSLMPLLGSMRSSAAAVRGVMGDSLLSFFGAEGLTGAIDALAQSGQIAAGTFPTVLRGLGNFARDGKQLAQLAEIFSMVTQQGKVTQQTLGSLTGLNPVFASAIAEIATGKVLTGDAATKIAEQAVAAGKVSAEDFGKAFSGELASTDLWEGQLERMAGTLQGLVMGLIVRLKDAFTDFGVPFLDPFKDAIMEMEQDLRNGLMRMRGVVARFGIESFIPGVESTFETFINFVVKSANEALPKLIGFMGKFREIMDGVKDFFMNMGAVLGPLEAGADKMMKLFGPFFRNLFGARGIGGLIMSAAEDFEKNADSIERMGQALGDFAFQFMGLFRDIQDSFFSGSDSIAEFIQVLATDLMPLIREMSGLFRDMWREALPTISRILREIHGILSPILGMLSNVVGSMGPLGNMMMFGLLSAKKGGLPALPMMGAGLGGGMFGAPGAAAGWLGASMLGSKAKKAGGAAGILNSLGMGGRHGKGIRGAGGLAAMGGTAPLMAAAGTGLGTFMGASALNKHFGSEGGWSTNAGIMAGGGAVAGAGVGAAVGLMGGPFAPVTVPVGMIVGGIIGAIGAALGTSSGNKMREQARTWIDEQMEAVSGEFGRALEKGSGRAALEAWKAELDVFVDPKNIKKMAEELKMTEEEMEKIARSGIADQLDEIEVRTRALDSQLGIMADITGDTTSDLEELANIMAVDLSDGIGTLMQDMVDLGLVFKTQEDLIADTIAKAEESVMEAMFGSGSFIGGERNKAQAATVREQLQGELDVIKAAGAAGDTGAVVDTFGRITEMFMTIGQLEFGAEGVELLHLADQALQQLSDPTGEGYGGAFVAQTIAPQRAEIDAEIAKIMNGSHPMWDGIRVMQDTMSAQSGGKIGNFDSIFQSSILPQLETEGYQYANIIATEMGTASFQLYNYIISGGTAFQGTVESSAAVLGTTLFAAAAAIAAAIGQAGAFMSQSGAGFFGGGAGTGEAYKPPGSGGGGGGNVSGWTNKNGQTGNITTRGDTRTSRFNRVLGFHSRLSSRLGGRFSITSGMRSFGLGSMSSDHLTGGAIDLVGDNLGQYANAVNDMGGFAEFHGRGGSRHLHAVPPIGDTASARGGMGGGMAGANIAPVFYISGADDPEVVANKVITKIEKLIRDESERS